MKNVKIKGKRSKALSFGGDEILKTVSIAFSVSGDSLKTYHDLSRKLSDHCVLNIDDFLYCVGGKVDGKWGNSAHKVYRINLKTPNLKWEEVSSMAEKRNWFGATLCNGCLVVAGGYRGGSVLWETELY